MLGVAAVVIAGVPNSSVQDGFLRQSNLNRFKRLKPIQTTKTDSNDFSRARCRCDRVVQFNRGSRYLPMPMSI